ncbi:MAG: hypothetical protein OES57_14255 [Acidimicrobiia bacterium]|nr:hypothetical protein [Acidimicrobiia bacterium]
MPERRIADGTGPVLGEASCGSVMANAASISAPERVDEIIDSALALAPSDAIGVRANLEARRVDPVVLWHDLDEGAVMLDELLAQGAAEHDRFLAGEAALIHLTRGDHTRVRELLPHLVAGVSGPVAEGSEARGTSSRRSWSRRSGRGPRR